MPIPTEGGPGSRRRRAGNALPGAAFLVAGIAALALGAAVLGPGSRGAGGISVWSGTVVDGTELESYASLSEMTRSADAVVRGRVIALAPGRTFGDPSSAVLHYAAATVRVDELLAGDLPAQDEARLTLEIPLFGGAEEIGPMRSALPWSESVFFLRNKGESARVAGLSLATQQEEARFYRLVVLRGVIANEGGSAAVAADAAGFLAELHGVAFAEVVDGVRKVGAGGP